MQSVDLILALSTMEIMVLALGTDDALELLLTLACHAKK
jgi:hypothetical protein